MNNQEIGPDNNLKNYSNPAKNQVNVNKNNPSDNQILKIYTIQGQLVEERNLENKRKTIEMSGWSPGIYLFKQIGTQQTQTYKVLKQ
mgnify:CR=1 FL=1